jgi:hypothetical protein
MPVAVRLTSIDGKERLFSYRVLCWGKAATVMPSFGTIRAAELRRAPDRESRGLHPQDLDA